MSQVGTPLPGPGAARSRFTYFICPQCKNRIGLPEGVPAPTCSGSHKTFQHRPTRMEEQA